DNGFDSDSSSSSADIESTKKVPDKPTTAEEESAKAAKNGDADLFSLDISAISDGDKADEKIDDKEEEEEIDPYFNNPFNNEVRQGDIDAIFDTAITGEVDDGDSEEDN